MPQCGPVSWRRLLRVAYLLAVAVAFVAAVASRRAELAEHLGRTDPLPVAGAVVAGLAGVGISALVWRRMLAGVGARLPGSAVVRVFFLAQVGKYLPGSVWPVLAQAEMGADHGVPRRSAVAAQTLFMWVHLITGAVLGIPTLAATGTLPLWTALAAPALVLLLLPGPLGTTIDWLLRRLRRAPLPVRPTLTDMAVATGWALVMWACYGLHTHWLVDAFEVPAPGILPLVVATGAFAAAWSAGFVFLIAPAGAGAREVVLIAALGAVTAPETAFTVALLSRLVLTLADGAWAGVGLLAGVGASAWRGWRRRMDQAGGSGSGVHPHAQDGPGQRGSDVGDRTDG